MPLLIEISIGFTTGLLLGLIFCFGLGVYVGIEYQKLDEATRQEMKG